MRASVKPQYTGNRPKPKSVRHLSGSRVAIATVFGLLAAGPLHVAASPRLTAPAPVAHLHAADAWDDLMIALLEALLRFSQLNPPPTLQQSSSVAAWAGFLVKEYGARGLPENLDIAARGEISQVIQDLWTALADTPDLRLDPLQVASLRMTLKSMYVEVGGDPADLGG